jgi:hypothetical protein
MSYLDDAYLEGYYDALSESEEDLDIYDYDDDGVDFEDDYDDAYLEGYYDALNEMEIQANPFPMIGGGDFVGDIKANIGVGDSPDRIAATKYYLDKGNTIKGGLLKGTYGSTNGVLYRKNSFLPGARTFEADTMELLQLYERLKPNDRKRIMSELRKKAK